MASPTRILQQSSPLVYANSPPCEKRWLRQATSEFAISALIRQVNYHSAWCGSTESMSRLRLIWALLTAEFPKAFPSSFVFGNCADFPKTRTQEPDVSAVLQ